MSKRTIKAFLIFASIFGLTQLLATDIYPFFLQRQDGTVLEGYFSPPSAINAPIIFAIQGSSCQSVLDWHRDLSEQVSSLGLGVIVLEKQGISSKGVNSLTYSQTNCLQNRLEDYILCLENAHVICPGWEGRPIFWGESEGGTLATALARQTPQTAAVLLFGVGGGMKHREEVKWALYQRLEKHGALQDEIDAYMSFLDNQMEDMILNPTSEKQFLGNTYKWWASFLAAEEAGKLLNQQFLPICLVHGVEDSQIPVLSADMAAENLAKTNTLTYLRLEGYGHDLNTADVQDAARHWLISLAFGQEPLDHAFVAPTAPLPSALIEDWQTDISHYVLRRGKKDGELYAETRGHKDTNGNGSLSANVGASKEFDNGIKIDVSGELSAKRDSSGETKGEVKVEGRISTRF